MGPFDEAAQRLSETPPSPFSSLQAKESPFILFNIILKKLYRVEAAFGILLEFDGVFLSIFWFFARCCGLGGQRCLDY